LPTINPAKIHSISKSIFPDAPTTPKVIRKTLYDDEDDINTQVKEIVKKYQLSNESQQQTTITNCCKETNECLIYKADSTSQKVDKSSELNNKEITC
jgi:hypothetical protein